MVSFAGRAGLHGDLQMNVLEFTVTNICIFSTETILSGVCLWGVGEHQARSDTARERGVTIHYIR